MEVLSIKSILKIRKTKREWHLPILAGLAIGIPLLVGWLINDFQNAKIASLSGLSILYIQSNKLSERMIILMTCCFGLLTCYTAGLFFSNNTIISPIILGLMAFSVHYSLNKLELNAPPGNFFFIMLASIAICSPLESSNIPLKVGYMAIGTIFVCILALIYSLLTLKNNNILNDSNYYYKDLYTNIKESIIFGSFISISLFIALIAKFENPYWIPISCLAVMQGLNYIHIWERGIQRIIGTIVGLLLTWLLAYTSPSTLAVIIIIVILQMIIEFFVVRNYMITVIFITSLTIFLAESDNVMSKELFNQIFLERLLDILIGSIIGIIGGWFLYNEKVHYYIKKR